MYCQVLKLKDEPAKFFPLFCHLIEDNMFPLMYSIRNLKVFMQKEIFAFLPFAPLFWFLAVRRPLFGSGVSTLLTPVAECTQPVQGIGFTIWSGFHFQPPSGFAAL
jgi:hypothetical protein